MQLLTLLPLLSLSLPLTLANPAPQPTPSTTPSQITTVFYVASPNCEFTSSTTTLKTNQCATLYDSTDNNGQSYQFGNLVRGNDYPGDSCSIETFNSSDCSGTPTSTIAAAGYNSPCEVADAPISVKLVC